MTSSRSKFSQRLAPADAAPFVLLVDDDPAVADMYRLGLEAFGFRVATVGDSSGLFQKLTVEIPDLLVLDWQLPGLRGDEILERIRLDERTKTLGVFMLSNFPGQKNGAVDRVFRAGALAWLQKVKTPPALLAEKLSEALASSPPSRA